MKKKLTLMYWKTLEAIDILERDRNNFENTYLWGRGKELRQQKLKLKLLENRL